MTSAGWRYGLKACLLVSSAQGLNYREHAYSDAAQNQYGAHRVYDPIHQVPSQQQPSCYQRDGRQNQAVPSL